MVVELVLVFSVLFQYMAAFLALRLTKMTGKRLAWTLIATAIFLMGIRRTITLYRLLSGDTSLTPDLVAELVALVISVLMVTGIAWIAPLFFSIKSWQVALRESEERYQVLFEGNPDAIVITDSESGVVIDANPTASNMTLRPHKELVGLHLSQIRPSVVKESSKKTTAEPMRLIRQKKQLNPVEDEVFRSDGSIGLVEVLTQEVQIEGRRVLQSIFRDITERRRAEERLRRSEASLAEAQRIAHLGSWDADRLKNELVWSDEVYRIFGLTPQEITVSHETFMSFVHPDDRDFVQKAVDEAIRDGKGYSIDHRIIRPDGSERIVHEHGEVTFDETGRAIRMIGTVHDITERKKAEEEIRKLNEELEQRVLDRTAQLESANKELEAFSYSVSHDLRAPLRSIDGFSKALLEDYEDNLDSKGKRYLKRVRAASQLMGNLIDDILKLSRISRSKLRREEVDLSSMAREIAIELQRSEPERCVEFVIADKVIVAGDERLLRVAMNNLLGNAWKFTRTHACAKIEVGVTELDGNQVYFVRDDGAGFDMAYIHKLFSPFQRLHSTTEFSGTGIGLATVQRITHRHGGAIWAEGAVEKGATFYFTLNLRGEKT